MTTPLVSVVIPTYGRPQYLPRAVNSALSCQGDSVEVIVVPNGPDESWKQSLGRWRDDARVRVFPIAVPHGNAARNHGMWLAQGKYIRFLDDDDYLLPDAKSQIRIMERTDADICSGLVDNIDEYETHHGLVNFPTTKDFICAAVSISGFTLPVGNLYRRCVVRDYQWDESVARAQDNAWMIDLAKGQEWSWTHCAQPVGVWFQHRASRTSSTAILTGREDSIINRLILLRDHLDHAGRLNASRRAAIADGLWYYIQRGFPSHPFYWSRIGGIARAINPRSRMPGSFYQKEPLCRIQPLLLQWLLLPVRWATRSTRRLMAAWQEPDYRRQL